MLLYDVQRFYQTITVIEIFKTKKVSRYFFVHINRILLIDTAVYKAKGCAKKRNPLLIFSRTMDMLYAIQVL